MQLVPHMQEQMKEPFPGVSFLTVSIPVTAPSPYFRGLHHGSARWVTSTLLYLQTQRQSQSTALDMGVRA